MREGGMGGGAAAGSILPRPNPSGAALFRRLATTRLATLDTLNATTPLFVVPASLRGFAAADGPLPSLILVADNPGRTEWEDGEFLSPRGASGKMARAFFDRAFGQVGAFGREILVANRSSYHTPRTGGLEALLRGCEPNLGAALRSDQRAWGEFIAQAAAAIGVPVLEIGGGTAAVSFAPYREAFQAALSAVGSLPDPVRRAPHFSHSQFFRAGADAARTARLAGFAAAHQEIAGLLLATGSVSWRVLQTAPAALCAEFLLSVTLHPWPLV